MTTITGNLTDSGTTALPSILRVTLDAPLHDTLASPARLLTTVPAEIDVSSGTFTIDLPESASSNITYYFELLQRSDIRTYYKADGIEYSGGVFEDGGEYFTGDPGAGGEPLSYTDRTEDTVVMAFRAIVPESVGAVAFGDLTPTGITREVLDANLARLAQILALNPDLQTEIAGLVGDAANVAIAPTPPLTATNVAAIVAELLGLAALTSNDLSDLADSATARGNLGLGSAAVAESADFAAADHGHTADEVAFEVEPAGGTKVALTNAPNAIAPSATPDEWVRIQIAGNTYVYPAWRI